MPQKFYLKKYHPRKSVKKVPAKPSTRCLANNSVPSELEENITKWVAEGMKELKENKEQNRKEDKLLRPEDIFNS